MKIRHYDIKNETGLAWYGLKRMDEAWPLKESFKQAEKSLNNKGIVSERQLEVDCFLSLIEDAAESDFTMFEIGAGWGEWSMALTGVIRNRLVNTKVQRCRSIAVEALPCHAEICKGHFVLNGVDGDVVNCAVSDKICEAYFHDYARGTYGQSLCFKGRNNLFGVFNLLTRRYVKVRTTTVDELVQEYGAPTLLHMDVQGTETAIIRSLKCSPKYIIVGTHGDKHNRDISSMLGHRYDSVIDVYPNTVSKVEGIGTVEVLDGLQVWKCKS